MKTTLYILLSSMLSMACLSNRSNQQDNSDLSQKKIKIELLESCQKKEQLLKEIGEFKVKLRKDEVLSKNEINILTKKLESEINSSDILKTYFKQLKENTNQQQYKYMVLIEDFVYQKMISALQEVYLQSENFAPLVFTDKKEYNTGEDVSIFIVFNSNEPIEIVLNGRSVLIDNISFIQLKAEGKGNRTVKGLLRYQLNHEKVEAPFEVTYEVR